MVTFVVSNLFLSHKTGTRLKTEDYKCNDYLLSSPLVSHQKLNIDHPMKLPIFPRSAEISFPRCERSGKIPRSADNRFSTYWRLLVVFIFPRTVGNPRGRREGGRAKRKNSSPPVQCPSVFGHLSVSLCPSPWAEFRFPSSSSWPWRPPPQPSHVSFANHLTSRRSMPSPSYKR